MKLSILNQYVVHSQQKKKKKNQYVVNYVNLEGRILIDQREIIFLKKN